MFRLHSGCKFKEIRWPCDASSIKPWKHTESGSIAPPILNFSNKLQRTVGFTPRLIQTQGNSHNYPPSRRLRDSKIQYLCLRTKENFFPLSAIEPPFLGHPGHILVTTSSELSLFPMSGNEVTKIEEPGCYGLQCRVKYIGTITKLGCKVTGLHLMWTMEFALIVQVLRISSDLAINNT